MPNVEVPFPYRQEAVSYIGTLEADLLTILWDAGEGLPATQVFEALYLARREQKQEMQSPSTVAVTLSRMVEKGLLVIERRAEERKGYYAPTFTRVEAVSLVLDDVARRLTGQPLGYLLSRLRSTEDTGSKKQRSTPTTVVAEK